MKNPAEETTVRPNQTKNQTQETESIQFPNSFCMRKNHNFSHTITTTISQATIQPKPETGSPFFANQLVNIAMKKSGQRVKWHPKNQ